MNEEQERVAEVMCEFTQHEGWMMVETYILDRVKDCETRLITSCKPEEVTEIRKQRDALRGVLRHVEELIAPNTDDTVDRA